MYSGRHVSFKTVLWRAMNQPFVSDLSEEQAADYALELIRRLQIGFSFGESVEYSNINKFKASIPSDLVFIRGVRYINCNSIPDELRRDTTPDFIKDEGLVGYLNQYPNWLPAKYTGYIYHSDYHCNGQSYPDDQACDITYTLNNNYVNLSEEEGIIQIAYRSLLTDDEGYPMIPDDQSFQDALYYYILKEHLFGLLATGKVSERFYNKLEQEYSWSVGQAQNNLKLAGMDHWESSMNGIRRLIHDHNQADDGFKNLHTKEQIRKY